MSTLNLWVVIILLGIGTFLIRFSFLGAIGRRSVPPVVERLLRFTPVAVLPALIAPATIWPDVAEGAIEPVRLTAAAITLVVGVWSRNAPLAMAAGFGTLVLLLWVGG